MAEVIPFPLNCRYGLIRKQVARYVELSPEAAERGLQRLLEQQYEVLVRKGVPGDVATDEVRFLEMTLRACVNAVSKGGVA